MRQNQIFYLPNCTNNKGGKMNNVNKYNSDGLNKSGAIAGDKEQN